VARSAEQTLVTAAVLDDVPAELRSTVVHVAGGQAVPLGADSAEDAEDGAVREEVP
jgi:DNA replication and repair protein RecF